MKTLTHHLIAALWLGLLLVSAVSVSQAQEIDRVVAEKVGKSFAVNMIPGQQERINLLLDLYSRKRVTVRMKDPKNNVVYFETFRNQPGTHWRKFNFADSKPGQYRFEISNGDELIVRTVELVALPAVASQRYLTYFDAQAQDR